MRLYRERKKREKSATDAGLSFRCNKWGKGERVLLVASVGPSIPGIYGQRTLTNERAKRKVPHLRQAQQALACLWSISETLQCQNFHGIFNKSTVSRRVCWSLTVLWGSVSAEFRPFHREVGWGLRGFGWLVVLGSTAL